MKYRPRTQFVQLPANVAKLEWFIEMDIHPDYNDTKRDPRKVWLYDCCSGKFATTYNPRYDVTVTYYFEKEQDFLMFKLRWE